MGTHEDGAANADAPRTPELRRFRELFDATRYSEGVSLATMEVDGALHDEAAWAARLPDLLRFLFPPE
jgi:hypothetical protein